VEAGALGTGASRGVSNGRVVTPFRRTVADLFKARFPFVYVQTWEEDRVVAEVAAAVSDASLIKTPRNLYVWSSTTGLAAAGSKAKSGSEDPLKALEMVESLDEPAVFVFKDFHSYFGSGGRTPDSRIIRKVRDLAPTLKNGRCPKNVLFVSPTVVLPHELQKDISVLDFDMPTVEEIRGSLQEIIEANRQTGRITIDLTPDDEERLTKAALGLTLQEAENAFARAMVQDGRLDGDDVEVVLEEKRQIIKKTEILEFIRSDSSFDDVGGLENLKRWLAKRNRSWLDAARRYNLPFPKGILITGVPGCGKSLTAKCMSTLWQLPLLRLDVGRVFSGLVGSSEENMRLALRTAEAISPSILWIDEIEKGFAGSAGGGDSGTSSRVFGTFLTWMQEKARPVFVIATANSIEQLPPEFLRKGRFDEVFFVDLPTRPERKQILALHIERRLTSPEAAGDFELDEESLAELVDLSEGYSGAEIEQATVAALFEAFSEDRSVRSDDFVRALSTMVPLSVTQAEQIRATREWANVRAIAATAHEDRTDYAEASAGDGDVRASRGGRTVDF
jgi:SpoVK/Ycf46/Vps4 family AAA+-type ATPase